MEIKVYKGRFGEEQFLFEDSKSEWVPCKNDLIFYKREVYKVMYVMFDYDHNETSIFVREAIEEDF